MVAKSGNMYNTTGTNTGLDYHNGIAFSTTDRDQDQASGNCAASRGDGGWWYAWCEHLNLNGRMAASERINTNQMVYYDGGGGGRGGYTMLSSSEMRMIRVGWLEDKLRLRKMTIQKPKLTTKDWNSF